MGTPAGGVAMRVAGTAALDDGGVSMRVAGTAALDDGGVSMRVAATAAPAPEVMRAAAAAAAATTEAMAGAFTPEDERLSGRAGCCAGGWAGMAGGAGGAVWAGGDGLA